MRGGGRLKDAAVDLANYRPNVSRLEEAALFY